MNFRTVGSAPRVVPNQREPEINKPLSVFWERTSVTLGQIVKIRGVIKNPAGILKPTLWVLYNGSRFQPVWNIEVVGGQVTAEWRVMSYKSGDFTDGTYDLEIIYRTLIAKSSEPLRIGMGGYNPNVSSFEYK